MLKSIILTIREILLRIISLFLFQPKRIFSDDQIRRVLIIRIDGIGDMMLTIPAIKALRRRFPNAHIAVMTLEVTGGLLSQASYIDEVIIYREGMNLKELSFDLVFDFLDDYPLKTALMAYSVKSKYRVGFDIKGRGIFFNLKAVQPNTDRHYVDAMLDLVALVEAKANDRSLELNISSVEGDETGTFLRNNNIQKGNKLICIHPGAKNWTSQWPTEYFARFADEVSREQSVKVIFIGAAYDSALIGEIKTKITGDHLFYIGYSLRSVAALINQSNILVCNNSGLLHVACALKIPTVSTMGPTSPKKWWPVGSKNVVLRKDIPCIGCGKGYCRIKTHDCMKKITVEDMLEAVNSQLA